VPGHIFAEFGDIESVKRTLDSEVAAIILEPIQSMAGIKCAPPLFFQELKSLCEQNGTLLIFDEVQTGIGRTGNWFFSASEAAGGVLPDIISLAKALGSGVPVSACLTTERVASQIKENDLGTTFGGGMLAMAALLATLDIIENEKLLENVRQVESYLRQHLLEIPGIKAVRGLGFLLGIEFERPASEIQKALLDKNIITGTSSDPKVLRLLPPLTLKHEEADLLIHSLSQVLS
jgi:acetylornithine/N-succinyldiaminopimelate aminotransferase